MWRHAYDLFYHTYETWNLKWRLTFCRNKCILTEEGTSKNHPGQNLPDKRHPDKNSRTKSPVTDWERICTEGFYPDLCTRPAKNGWSEMCDVLSGGSGMCDKVWQGEGGQNLAKNSVMYFMDSPSWNKIYFHKVNCWLQLCIKTMWTIYMFQCMRHPPQQLLCPLLVFRKSDLSFSWPPPLDNSLLIHHSAREYAGILVRLAFK